MTSDKPKKKVQICKHPPHVVEAPTTDDPSTTETPTTDAPPITEPPITNDLLLAPFGYLYTGGTIAGLLSYLPAGSVLLATGASALALNELLKGIQDIYDGRTYGDNARIMQGAARVTNSLVSLGVGVGVALLITKLCLISSGPIGWAVLLACAATATILTLASISFAHRHQAAAIRAKKIEGLKSDPGKGPAFLARENKILNPGLTLFGTPAQKEERKRKNAFSEAAQAGKSPSSKK